MVRLRRNRRCSARTPVMEPIEMLLNEFQRLERRETRKVGQREEKRTREAGTKMQCSTWSFILGGDLS